MPLNSRGASRLVVFLVFALWFGLLGLAGWNRQNIFDWWRLRNYEASAVVKQLAEQDTMTPYGAKVFFVNHPSIDDRAAFTEACPNNGGEQTIVLGCYHSNQAGISLLKVDDPRLNGVQQVTAAHEMLHAAYDRLSSTEKKRVNALLMDYYRRGLTDERIKKTIEAYKKSEPADVVNEMHSIFGSEIASLPAALERHYQRYFSNRAQIAALAAQYQAAFTSREAALAAQKAELDSLKSQIDGYEAELKSQQTAIDAEQARLQNLRASGDVSAYNAGVPGFNRLVDNYNNEIKIVQGLIDRFNSLRVSFNALVFEEDQLIKELSGAPPVKQ